MTTYSTPADDISTGKLFLESAESGLRWKVKGELLPELKELTAALESAGDDVDKIAAVFEDLVAEGLVVRERLFDVQEILRELSVVRALRGEIKRLEQEAAS